MTTSKKTPLSKLRAVQDDFLLRFSQEIHKNQNHSFVDRLVPIDQIDFDREVELPVILLETFRKESLAEDQYVFPGKEHPAMSAQQYIRFWAPFAYLVMTHGHEAGQPYWTKASLAYSQKHGHESGLEFIRALWRNRWINSRDSCAALLGFCKMSIAERSGRERDSEYWIEEAFRLKKEIEDTRDKVRNLTDWLDALFNLAPEVIAMRDLLREGDESEKYRRYFEESRVDMITTRAMVSLAFQKEESHPMSRQYLPLSYLQLKNPGRRDEALQDIRRTLMHNYRGRTVLPRYWYELACANLETPLEDLPRQLDEYDLRSFKAAECFAKY